MSPPTAAAGGRHSTRICSIAEAKRASVTATSQQRGALGEGGSGTELAAGAAVIEERAAGPLLAEPVFVRGTLGERHWLPVSPWI
jgi:hypothetical protein